MRLEFLVPVSHFGRYGDRAVYHRDNSLNRARLLLTHSCHLWHSTFQHHATPQRGRVLQTVHDLIGYQGDLERMKALQERLDRSVAVAFVSSHTRELAAASLRLPGHSRVIWNGLPGLPDQSRRPSFLDSSPFLLSLGELRPRKQLGLLISLMEHLPQYRLILAGNRNCYPHHTRQLQQQAHQLGLCQRVDFPGIVTETEKRYLLENCEAFLFPSSQEGFGLPALEAQQFGKPTFLSRHGSLPEVGGPAAFYWSCDQPEAMAREFVQGMAVFDLVRAEESRQWAHRFSWREAAESYLAFYSRLLDQ